MMKRVPYCDEAGIQIGTCIPIERHTLTIRFEEWTGPRAVINCPDEANCISLVAIVYPPDNEGCWLRDWVDEAGWEVITGESKKYRIVDAGSSYDSVQLILGEELEDWSQEKYD